MRRMRWVYSMVAVLAMMSLPASAATIFSDTFDPQQAGWSYPSPSPGFLGWLNNNVNVSNVTLTIPSPNYYPNATLEFDLLGFETLDGFNTYPWTDILTLTINGTIAFMGAWGDNEPYVGFSLNPSGATFINLGPGAFGSSSDHHFEVPHAVLAGVNTYNWAYTPLQYFPDEAWGLDNTLITADVTAVPEPATALLVTTGLLSLIAARKRR